MATVTVSEKGWVVIPKEIRKKFGLKKGSKVSIVDYNGAIYLVPLPSGPTAYGWGIFKDGPSLTEALLEDRRIEREREEAEIEEWFKRDRAASES